MPEREVSILALLKDKFTGPLGGITRGLKVFTSGLLTAGRIGKTAFTGVFSIIGRLGRSIFNLRNLLLAGAFAGVIKVFKDFERGLANVATLVDTNVVSMEKLGDVIISVSKATGEGFDSLNKALFDTVSAGVDAEKAGAVLLTSSQLAQAGATTTAEATKGLVSVMNAYGLAVEDAGTLADAFFQAQKGGITTIGELSGSIGKLAPVARIAGLSVDEMLAAVAALTKSGLSTAEAVNAMRSVLTGLIKPQQTATETAKLLGLELSTASIKGGRFTNFLKEVAEKTNLNEELVAKLFGNIRAFAGIANLATDDAKNFRDILASMADKTGSVDEAFKKVSETLDFKISQFTASLKAFFVVIGQAAKPFIVDVLDKFSNFVDGLAAKKAQLTVVIGQVVAGLKQIWVIAKTIFKKGDTVKFVVNIVSSAIQAAIQVVQAAIPVLLSVARQVGRKIGIAILDALFGSSNEALARKLADGKRGIFRASLVAFGIDDSTLEEFAQKGRQLLDAEKNLLYQRGKLAQATTGRTPGSLPSPIETIGGRKTIDAAAARALVEQAQRDLLNAQKGLAGSAISDLSEVDAAATSEAVKAFSDRIPSIMAHFGENLKEGLDPLVRAEIDRLGEIFGSEWAEKMKVALAADDAMKAAEDAGKAIGGAIATGAGTGIVEGEGGGIQLGATVDDLTAKFDELKKAMDEFRQNRTRIQQQREGGFISGPDALAQEAAALQVVKDRIAQIEKEYEAVRAVAQGGELVYLENATRTLIEQLGVYKAELADLGEQGTFFTGLTAGIETTVEKMANLRNLGLEVGTSLATALGDGLEEAVTKGSKALGDFALKFLRDIALMIAKAFLFQAVLAGLKAVGGPFASIGSFVTANSGGRIPGPNVNRDVVPAMLTPGEFVIPRGAVDHYGTGIMEALRRRLIPRNALSAFGASGVPPKGTHLNAGGQASQSSVVPSPAYIVADEQAMDRMLRGGSNSMFEFLRRNADTISGILGRRS